MQYSKVQCSALPCSALHYSVQWRPLEETPLKMWRLWHSGGSLYNWSGEGEEGEMTASAAPSTTDQRTAMTASTLCSSSLHQQLPLWLKDKKRQRTILCWILLNCEVRRRWCPCIPALQLRKDEMALYPKCVDLLRWNVAIMFILSD